MNTMQESLEELDRLLEQEIDAHQQLLTLQQQEKQLLLAWSLEPFQANLQAKEHLAQSMLRLERKCQCVLSRLASLLQLPPTEVTLQHLSVRIKEPYASTLLRHRARLQQLVSALQHSNRGNNRLLQDSLALVNGALAFFTSLGSEPAGYHPTGKVASSTPGRLLSGRA
jgi:flagellar biosynthesis/type III secretory pathway chaperone